MAREDHISILSSRLRTVHNVNNSLMFVCILFSFSFFFSFRTTTEIYHIHIQIIQIQNYYQSNHVKNPITRGFPRRRRLRHRPTHAGDIGLLRSERLAGDGTSHRNADAVGESGAPGAGTAGCGWSTRTPSPTYDLSAAAPDSPTEHVLRTERIQHWR